MSSPVVGDISSLRESDDPIVRALVQLIDDLRRDLEGVMRREVLRDEDPDATISPPSAWVKKE